VRLTTIAGPDGAQLAVVYGAQVLPVASISGSLPTTLQGLLDAGPAVWTELEREVRGLSDAQAEGHAIRNPRFLAPIPRPRKNILCVGRNYADHAAEQGAAAPVDPVLFTKAPTTVVGHEMEVPHPPGVQEFDYEGELALIIGVGGVNIRKENAMQHVFGYTALNDLTARDAQRRHLQWFKGKSYDASCPMGPVVVSAHAMGDLASVRVQTRVNGELRQDQPVSDMLFDIPTIIEVLSHGMTLEPGDVIATGTPSGVGAPSKRFLKPGDVVEVEVSGIGVLRNRISEGR
jgi:2-keto-4-pentenoate hydratase/2-oxohepta-3-ene-1,7-dioic acid hydratase in catechol pathway